MHGDHWFRHSLPYTLHLMPGQRKKHTYLPLNRDYKPLGVVTMDHVRYEDYLDRAVVFGTDPHRFTDIWIPWDARRLLYLYTDNNRSVRDYFERLGRLCMRQMLQVSAVTRHRR